MTALGRYLRNLDVLTRENIDDHLSLDPEYVERVLRPKPPSDGARRNAAYAAQLLEEDRRHV